jgi:hypothetical protein
MTDTQLQRMAQAAVVIRQVLGQEFQCEQPNLRRYGQGSVLILIHEPGDPLRPYCNYDCYEYEKIDALTDALSEIGLYVQDCTGDYSAVYESKSTPEGGE